MRNLLLASAVALSAALSFGVSARADDMNNGQMMHHNHMHDHCMMKSVKHHDHHGHWVWTKEKVCR